MKRRKLMMGNWKMYKTRVEADQFMSALVEALGRPLTAFLDVVDVGIAPQFLLIEKLAKAFSHPNWWVAAQNVHHLPEGAYTGEVSIPMLRDIGGRFAIVGHSERRQYFGDTDELVGQKVEACLKNGIHPIVCIGETINQRQEMATERIIATQLAAALRLVGASTEFTIAYEPVWAIGTGLAATSEQAQAVHAFIRAWLTERLGLESAAKLRILYGGSTKPENISELLHQPDIDGALIGGASLNPKSFAQMISIAAS